MSHSSMRHATFNAILRILTVVTMIGMAAPAMALPDVNVICDGSITDTYPAINAAMQALGPNGGVVSLSPGTCYISQSIVISRNNVWIRGAGKFATIVSPTTANTNAFSIYGCTTTSSSCPAVFHNRISDLTINPVSGPTPGYGIWITYGANDTIISDIEVDNVLDGIHINGYVTYPATSISTIRIQNTDIKTVTNNGLYIEQAAELFLSNMQINNGTSRTGYGIHFESASNAVYGDRLNAAGFNYGIFFGDTQTIIQPPKSRDHKTEPDVLHDNPRGFHRVSGDIFSTGCSDCDG